MIFHSGRAKLSIEMKHNRCDDIITNVTLNESPDDQIVDSEQTLNKISTAPKRKRCEMETFFEDKSQGMFK